LAGSLVGEVDQLPVLRGLGSLGRVTPDRESHGARQDCEAFVDVTDVAVGVRFKGDSYRLKDRDLGRGPATTDEQ
jgi:hypothetical protein